MARVLRSLRFIGAALLLLAAAGLLRADVSIGTIEEDPEVRKAMIRQKVEENYKEGMKARAAGDLATAVRYLRWAATTRCDTQFPELAFNELKVISEEGKKELQVARQLVSGEDPAAGLGELKRIARIYFGLGVAKDAGALALQLESDPAFQARMKAGRLLEELKKAGALEAQAEALLRPPAPEKPPAATTAKPPPMPPAAAPVKPAAEEVPASPPAPGVRLPAAADGPVNVAPLAPKPPSVAAGAPPAAAPVRAAGSETSAAPSPKSPWEEILREMPPAPPQATAEKEPPPAAPPPVGPPKPAAEKAGPAPLPTLPPEPPKPPGVITASVKPKEMTEAGRRVARLELLMQAYDICCRVAQQGAGTEPGKKAAEDKARLEKDADLMARIKAVQADRQAREWMSLADGYLRAGRFDLARQYCVKVISEFPHSQQAADARMMLERLK